MKKILDWIQKIQSAAGAIFLTIFLVTVIIQMFTRYLGISALWTEEVAMYSFIWSVFIGASVMIRERQHFAFTALTDKIKSEKGKHILNIVISLFMIAFNSVMFYYGVAITKKFWNYKWISLPSVQRGPTWLCLPICAALSILFLLEIIIGDVKAIREEGGNQ